MQISWVAIISAAFLWAAAAFVLFKLFAAADADLSYAVVLALCGIGFAMLALRDR